MQIVKKRKKKTDRNKKNLGVRNRHETSERKDCKKQLNWQAIQPGLKAWSVPSGVQAGI